MRKPGWVAKKTWNELSPRSRRLIVIGGAFEAVLKIVALLDLARRPADQVRGSKVLWGAVVVFANAVGAAPIAYFAYGRRRR